MLDIATDRSSEARILVVHLRGRIDALSAREFDDFFEDLLRGGERFFILRGNRLEAVSSAGIGSLVKFVRRLRGLGGGAVFVGLPEEIRLLLEFFGLGELLPAYTQLDEARAALEESLVGFEDKLEIKRESTLRTRVNPDRNRRAAKAAMRSYHARERGGRLRSELGTAHARSQAPRFPESGRSAEKATQARADSVPTESELEIMSASVPTDSRLEIMAASGPTASERASAAEAGERPSGGGSIYEQAILESEIVREAGAADADDEFEVLREEAAVEERWSAEKVMGCEQCGLNLRIVNFGLHMCPACGVEFDVRRDGNVSFYVNQ